MASNGSQPTSDGPPPHGRLRARLEELDDYGVALLLILATIITLAFSSDAVGQLAAVCLSGFTLLFVLHTSGARRRSFQAVTLVVVVAVAGAAAAVLTGVSGGSEAAGLVGLLLAFAAPLVILRRILLSPTITVRLVLGALAIYLLLGLAYGYLYPLTHLLTGQPFFVQTTSPESFLYVYFSYVTLTTVGYGDFTASTNVGRMMAVSEALVGQLYLVSAVALLIGNIGRKVGRRTPTAGVKVDAEDTSAADEAGPPGEAG